MATGTYATTAAWTWPATGTTWRIHHTGTVDEAAARAVTAAVAVDEARWSRFLASSDVSRINARAGTPVDVGPETLDLLEACNRWSRRTGGVFQPLVGGALVGWGYGRSLAAGRPHMGSTPASEPVRGTIGVDRRRAQAWVPLGSRLDLGGIAKSWMAARAGNLLAARCDDPCLLVDAGGDLVAVRGTHVVDVEGPFGAGAPPIGRVRLTDGEGVATSGFDRRHWRSADGALAHHLIDPDTGAPGIPAHATVVADDVVAADVLATTLALRPERISDMSERAMVIVDGRTRETSRWTLEVMA